jgi:hypothetical protein
MTKIAGFRLESGSISQRHGSADPDLYQNEVDPQHWRKLPNIIIKKLYPDPHPEELIIDQEKC